MQLHLSILGNRCMHLSIFRHDTSFTVFSYNFPANCQICTCQLKSLSRALCWMRNLKLSCQLSLSIMNESWYGIPPLTHTEISIRNAYGKNIFWSTLIGKSKERKTIDFPHCPFELPANQHSQFSLAIISH